MANDLELAVGGLSKPSKMPGYAYGIPAAECRVGSILRQKAGTVCSKCYAHKGMYSFPVVQNAQYRRLSILLSDLEAWTANMITLLEHKYKGKRKRDRVFRWHDSGDIQSSEHLLAIVRIAKALPEIRFWLPSKEAKTIRAYVAGRRAAKKRIWPKNLTVRVSAPVIGRPAVPVAGILSSTVGAGEGYSCPAPKQGNYCGSCRACWDKSVKSVDYHKH